MNIKALTIAAAVSAGVMFAMPAASQAMPAASPVKIEAGKDSNVVQAHYKKKKYSKKWSKKRWARYCRWADDWRCHRRHRVARLYRHHYYDPFYDPYYYGGFYGPRFYPGFGIHFRID